MTLKFHVGTANACRSTVKDTGIDHQCFVVVISNLTILVLRRKSAIPLVESSIGRAVSNHLSSKNAVFL